MVTYQSKDLESSRLWAVDDLLMICGNLQVKPEWRHQHRNRWQMPNRSHNMTSYSAIPKRVSHRPLAVQKGFVAAQPHQNTPRTTVSPSFCQSAPLKSVLGALWWVRRGGLGSGGRDDAGFGWAALDDEANAFLSIELRWVVVPLAATATARTNRTLNPGTTVVSPIPRCV